MEEARRSSAPVATAAVLLFVLVLPLIYVLSLGPAVWLVNHKYLDLELAQAIYWPLEQVVESCDWVQEPLRRYVELFG